MVVFIVRVTIAFDMLMIILIGYVQVSYKSVLYLFAALEKISYTYVKEPGLYVLCHCFNKVTHTVSKRGAVVKPFKSVEVAFDKDTFDEDEVTIDFKVTQP